MTVSFFLFPLPFLVCVPGHRDVDRVQPQASGLGTQGPGGVREN